MYIVHFENKDNFSYLNIKQSWTVSRSGFVRDREAPGHVGVAKMQMLVFRRFSHDYDYEAESE